MKTALVTGASRGIGHGIANRLAELGYGLTITARSTADLAVCRAEFLAAGAPEVAYQAADMADRDALPALVTLHEQHFITMNALVLNAGVGSGGRVSSYPIERLDKTVEVNLTAAFVLIKDSLRLLRAGAQADSSAGARIIGLSSITGAYPEAGLAVYGASKAALQSLLATVNLEESGGGVMATSISPAFVETDMSAWAIDAVPADEMIPVADVVAVVEMLLRLGPNTSIPNVIMARSGTSGHCA